MVEAIQHQPEDSPPRELKDRIIARRGAQARNIAKAAADAVVVLSLGRTAIYEQIRSGRLRSVTQGRTRLIPASAIKEYIALLEQEADAAL